VIYHLIDTYWTSTDEGMLLHLLDKKLAFEEFKQEFGEIEWENYAEKIIDALREEIFLYRLENIIIKTSAKPYIDHMSEEADCRFACRFTFNNQELEFVIKIEIGQPSYKYRNSFNTFLRRRQLLQ
jgi:hypothetical protein